MTDQKPAQPAKPNYLTFRIQGRINGTRRHEGKFYTHVTTPAPDEYAMPSQFEIRSSMQLGQQGDTFNGICKLSGFTRERSFLDKNTGEQRKVLDKTVIIDLVD